MSDPKFTRAIPDPNNPSRATLLQIDGVDVADSHALASNEGMHVYLRKAVAAEAFPFTRAQLQKSILLINIYLENFEGLNLSLFANLSGPDILGTRGCIRLNVAANSFHWAGPYSIEAMRTMIFDRLNSQNDGLFAAGDDDPLRADLFGGFSVSCEWGIDEKLNDLVRTVSVEGRALIRETHYRLIAEVQRDTLVTLFRFPPAVRVACEQYLVYFGQFLADLGIQAETSLQHHSGELLFSVTPRDGVEALDRIRVALDEYLSLYRMREFDQEIAKTSDIAAMQLQANVHHLKGQLALAAAIMRAKDAEIESLELSNLQYRQMAATQAEVTRLAQRDSGESEPLLGDFVAVTQVETTGLRLDLPRILRSLKRRFGSE